MAGGSGMNNICSITDNDNIYIERYLYDPIREICLFCGFMSLKILISIKYLVSFFFFFYLEL